MTADHAYVLTPTDVRNIRNYVQTKYAAMPHEQRAEIVADAITRIIHKQLPEFETGIKRKLTSTLIRTTVLEQQRPVCADDIYKLCMELDTEDERIAAPLKRWTREQQIRLMHPVSAPAESAEDNVIRLPVAANTLVSKQRRAKQLWYGCLSICLIVVAVLYSGSLAPEAPIDSGGSWLPPAALLPIQPLPAQPPAALNDLPADLRYSAVNEQRLITYLEGKNSILTEKHYFDAIITTSEQFDIHPALMFAITGQEQAFVPRTHNRAEEIANNPFNVFHSWQHFNTTIEQSAQIAARTITRLSKDKPPHIDAIVWINREYAEDPNWSKGVSSIFAAIKHHLEQPPEHNFKP